MNEQMKILVNMLKDRVVSNLQVIRKNEENIRLILKQPVSVERSNLLAEHFNINKKLLEENHDSLNIELQILNYINKYKELMKYQSDSNKLFNQSSTQENLNYSKLNYVKVDEDEQAESCSDADLLTMTINGELIFDSSHPMYDSEDFLDDLLDGFAKIENYEMCSDLLKLKGRK